MDPELKALLDKYAAAGASDDEIRQVAAAWKSQRSVGGVQDISPQLQQQADARQAQINAEPRSPGRVLAQRAVALSAGALPGSTAAGAWVAAKMSGRPYADVVRDLTAQMSDMPAVERASMEFVGGIPLAVATGGATESLPVVGSMKGIAGSAARGAVAGGGLAAAYRAAQPTPESVGNRASGALGAGAAGAALGGAVGAVAPMVAARRLASKVPSADIAASDAADAAKQTDAANFGRVHAEAVGAGGTSPAVRAALADPDLAPYVRDVESMPATRGLSDAEKLLAARNLMTERQGQIIGPMDSRHPGAGSTIENRSLGMMKGTVDRALTDPSQPIMPSLPVAEQEAAQAHRNADASDVVRKIARRELTGAKTPLNQSKLVAHGDFNTGRMFQQFDPGQRQAAQQAILSQLKETPRFYRVPFVRVPIGPSRASIVAPSLLDKMGDTRASDLAELYRNLTLAATSPQFGGQP